MQPTPPYRDIAPLLTTEQHHSCHHCGEHCPSVSIREDEYLFCCEGCKMVYQLLRDNNLCTYYDLNEHAGISFKDSFQEVTNLKPRSRFDYLENATVQRQLLEFANHDVARVSFHLPQIHCTSCLWLLEKLHKLHRGVISARVDFMQKNVSLSFAPDEISLRGVVELLTTLGYEPELHLQSLENNEHKGSQNLNTSLYLKIGVAAFAFANTMIFSFPEYLASAGDLAEPLRKLFGALSILLALPVLLYSASDYFRSSWQSLLRKHITLDVPIAMGILALFARSVIEIANGWASGYLDSFSGLVLLLLCGRLFQQKTFDTIAFDRDYKSYFPIAVMVRRNTNNERNQGFRSEFEGTETSIPLSELSIGERMIIRNKELIPADSVLQSTAGHVDYSFVTGESAPCEVLRGDTLFAGGRVVGQTLEMVSVKNVSQSYLTSLWNNEAFTKHGKSALETVANRFGMYFTLFVLALAALAFCAWLPDLNTALNAATAVLVVACPCAMTLAAPFALGWTMKIFGNAGFYLKNTSVVLELTRINTIVFDKTGTLTNTKGSRVHFYGQALSVYEQELLVDALQHSVHPLSRSVAAVFSYVGRQIRFSVENFIETPAQGLECTVDGHVVLLGSAAFVGCDLLCKNIQATQAQHKHSAAGASVYLSIDGCYKGLFLVENQYRSGLQKLFATLQCSFSLFLLSGDNDKERRALKEFFPETASMRFFQSPHDKLDAVRTLQEQGKHVMMIGDGLNDAGALQQSNVGIALTEGTGMFSPACDAALAGEQLNKLHDFIQFANIARRIIIIAFWISVVYNGVGLTFACMGYLSPLVSAILMPISNASVIGFTTASVLLAAKWRKI